MGYISRYDRTFISFINKKYSRYKVDFKTWDDYAIWLFYKYSLSCTNIYYSVLEKDIWAYSDWQTGSPRDRERLQLNDSWKLPEKDKYGLYKDDKYVEYLKRSEWKNDKN